MLRFSTKQKWVTGIVIGTVLASALIVFVITHRPRDWPTPTQARAALAESKWCDASAPIEKLDGGKVMIGHITCDLWKKSWTAPSDSPMLKVIGGLPGRFEYVRYQVPTPFGDWETPIGRWKARTNPVSICIQ